MSDFKDYEINKKLEDRMQVQLDKIKGAVKSAFQLELKKLEEAHDKQYAKEYELIDTLEEQLYALEDEIEILETKLLECDRCCEYVEKYPVEGWDYCQECYDDLDDCETCGAKGSQGTNTEPNNTTHCWDCGVTYCDECDHECPPEEEEE